MGEDQSKNDEDRFEDGLRQILDSAPSGGRGTAGNPPRPPSARPEGGARETAGKAAAEPKALFWFTLARFLAVPVLLLLLVKFVLRITAARG